MRRAYVIASLATPRNPSTVGGSDFCTSWLKPKNRRIAGFTDGRVYGRGGSTQQLNGFTVSAIHGRLALRSMGVDLNFPLALG